MAQNLIKTGPIGGGVGYKNVITEGDYTVKTAEELYKALKKSKTWRHCFYSRKCSSGLYISDLYINQINTNS